MAERGTLIGEGRAPAIVDDRVHFYGRDAEQIVVGTLPLKSLFDQAGTRDTMKALRTAGFMQGDILRAMDTVYGAGGGELVTDAPDRPPYIRVDLVTPITRSPR